MTDFKQTTKKYLELIKNNPKYLLIIAAVILVLILFINFVEGDKKSVYTMADGDANQYRVELEKRLSEQIGTVIKGEVNVMITLENSVEYIYASENKNNLKSVEDSGDENKQKVQKDEQNEDNYIIYKDTNGSEVPLVVTQVMPNIKGVVVSCENGENHVIQTKIKDLVKTALNISDDKVCVIGVDIN